jgi:3-deoxy-D-manno-octulosonic-acid transferase
MSLNLYRFLLILLSPFILVFLLYRIIIGKEHKKRYPERFGFASKSRPKGALIWFHAASIGEVVSVFYLIEKISEKYPEINILITTGTVTSAKLVESKFNKNIMHQFVPLDFTFAVKKFLGHWRPDFALWVESEVWPNLVCETAKTGSPLALVNARMSKETLNKWKKHKRFSKKIFESFSVCLAQNESEKSNFDQAGVLNSVNAGNLKFESPTLPADSAELTNVVKMIGDRKIWLFASSNEGEEEVAANCHRALEDKYSGLLTVIVPRHPNRAKAIAKILQEKNLNFVQRSKEEKVTKDTQVYLCDTIGELGIFYRISNVVFIGGSLVDRGGQNPLEPARLHCALISGNKLFNFAEIYSQMQQEHAVIIVNNEDELITNLDNLLADNKLQDIYANRALEFVTSKSGIVDNYLNQLDKYIKPLTKVNF